jgi:hypothetical protein
MDNTDPALLKMIHLSTRKSQSAASYFNSLKVVPVSISYEYDPNDQLKAKELDVLQTKKRYAKKKDEDLKSIADGITGKKGNVIINLTKPMSFAEDDNYQSISEKITSSIISSYKLQATNFAACKLLKIDLKQDAYSTEELAHAEKKLEARCQFLGTGARSKLLEQYANPAIRQMQIT